MDIYLHSFIYLQVSWHSNNLIPETSSKWVAHASSCIFTFWKKSQTWLKKVISHEEGSGSAGYRRKTRLYPHPLDRFLYFLLLSKMPKISLNLRFPKKCGREPLLVREWIQDKNNDNGKKSGIRMKQPKWLRKNFHMDKLDRYSENCTNKIIFIFFKFISSLKVFSAFIWKIHLTRNK